MHTSLFSSPSTGQRRTGFKRAATAWVVALVKVASTVMSALSVKPSCCRFVSSCSTSRPPVTPDCNVRHIGRGPTNSAGPGAPFTSNRVAPCSMTLPTTGRAVMTLAGVVIAVALAPPLAPLPLAVVGVWPPPPPLPPDPPLAPLAVVVACGVDVPVFEGSVVVVAPGVVPTVVVVPGNECCVE